ncbi:MAG: polysaccharide deacetylase [Clostridiales Family XIII bacterium]|jgi:peptidoglycan/xylan/chitin deacetylase (PgdA/CDA1 family)|nr:polysaccharide deacetylase [Clostridiales Family XIII bacterium]
MGVWKNGAKSAVMLTFDFDAETLWTARDPENAGRIGTLSHGEYAGKRGVHDILRMLKECEIKATFYVPGQTAERYPAVIEKIVDLGHEIGHHSYDHRWKAEGSLEDEEASFAKTLHILKKFTGKDIAGWRSPAWEVNAQALGILKKYGIRYSSNLMADYFPYWIELGGEASSIVELPVQWILDDAPYFLFAVRPPTRNIVPNHDVLQGWKDEFDGIYARGGLFNLTCHPQLSGRPSRVRMLAELIEHIRDFPDVWIATGEEIADHWRENADAFQAFQAEQIKF